LYLDYDARTGFGHISRARGFLEAISPHASEIYICSNSNPKVNESQLDFLNHVTWVSYEMAKLLHHTLIYVDTYDEKLLASFEYWSADLRVVLLDSNYSLQMPTWADFIIDMERSTPRNYSFQGEYLFGDILVHSELELSRQKIQDKCEKKIDLSNLAVAINFGGSQKVVNYFNKLKHIFLAHEEVSFYIYCPLALRKEVSLLFFELDNVKVEAFKSNYLQELPKYDLLITNTGTSFLEGLFVNIPMIIFRLFPNAIHNFDRFHKERLVLFSGTAHQLEVLDLTEAIKILYAKSDLHKSESNAESNLISIGLMEIQASLSKILK